MRSKTIEISTNMSLWKVKALGDVHIIWLTAHPVACLTVANVLSIICLDCCCHVRPLVHILILSVFATFWYILSHIVLLNWEFFTIVRTGLVEFWSSSSLNSCLVNSLPLFGTGQELRLSEYLYIDLCQPENKQLYFFCFLPRRSLVSKKHSLPVVTFGVSQHFLFNRSLPQSKPLVCERFHSMIYSLGIFRHCQGCCRAVYFFFLLFQNFTK